MSANFLHPEQARLFSLRGGYLTLPLDADIVRNLPDEPVVPLRRPEKSDHRLANELAAWDAASDELDLT